MKYDSLQKLFFKQPNDYHSIYHNRFNSEYAIHLDFDIQGFPAFYLRTPESIDLLLNIHKMDKKVRELIHSLPGIAQHQFAKRCLIDEVVLTNSIEGVNSTRRDITDVLESLKTQDKRKRFSGLVNKYLMLRETDELSIKTCEDIRLIYDDLVLKEVEEEDPNDLPDGLLFRKGSVNVYSSTQKIIHTGLYPESKIIHYMQKALDFLSNDEIEMLERISIFHYLFGYIHPFYNGNGRLSRFISSYLLSKELNSLISYRLSYTIKENIQLYYKAFIVCNDEKSRGDLTPFLLSFLEIVSKAIDQLYAALQKRLESLKSFAKMAEYIPFISESSEMENIAYLLIQAELFSEDGITTSELLEATEVTPATLRKRLSKFNSYQLLTQDRVGHNKTYRLNLKRLIELVEQYSKQ